MTDPTDPESIDLTLPGQLGGARPICANSSAIDARGATQAPVERAGTMFAGHLQREMDDAVVTSIARVRSGDRAELERVVRRELPRVQGLLRRLLGPRVDMDDLVQTVFLEMCRSLPAFRGESSLSTFVGGIAVRVARRAMRPTAWVRFRSPMPETPPAGADRPDDNTVATEQLRRLDSALSRLTADKRIAFVLWAVEGADVESIARMTKASVPATRSRIYYAQKELKVMAAADPYLRELVEGEHAG